MLLMLAKAACGYRRVRWPVLVLTKKVLCPYYAFSVVACVLVPLPSSWPHITQYKIMKHVHVVRVCILRWRPKVIIHKSIAHILLVVALYYINLYY